MVQTKVQYLSGLKVQIERKPMSPYIFNKNKHTLHRCIKGQMKGQHVRHEPHVICLSLLR